MNTATVAREIARQVIDYHDGLAYEAVTGIDIEPLGDPCNAELEESMAFILADFWHLCSEIGAQPKAIIAHADKIHINDILLIREGKRTKKGRYDPEEE